MTYAFAKLRIAFSMLLLSSFLTSAHGIAFTTKKIALVIGIGKYQPGNGWNTLHGDNDVDLMAHALMNAGFAEGNLFTLKNERATKAGITAALQQLLDNASAGDIIVIHFSGHGQQISDLDGDEADGLDEALVPFDAPASASVAKAYDGSKHLTDDELSVWFNSFRRKIGPSGQLIVFLDACHSGTASRGNGLVRGGVAPFLFAKSNQKTSVQPSAAIDGSGYMQASAARGNDQLSKFIMIAAARAEEQDYECPTQQLGSLSYAIADAFENKLKSTDNSFRDLFEYVRNTMAVMVPYQNPQLEGDKDIKIFDGSLVIQQPFYKVLRENKDGLLEMSAGRVLGITQEALIGLFPVGTRTTVGKTAVVTGKVIKTDYLKSLIKLDRKISIDSAKDLQAFILNPVFNNSLTNVFIAEIPIDVKHKLQEEFAGKGISVVQDVAKATLIIDSNKGMLEIMSAVDKSLIVNPVDYKKDVPVILCGGNSEGTVDPISYIVRTVNNYTKNGVLKNASFGDNNFGLTIQLCPAKIDQQTNRAALLPQQTNAPTFNTENSQAVLVLKNTGTRTGYVYLIEFDPSGRICPLVGFDTEIKLQPGAKDETVLNGFAPPYGRYLVKGYITEQPIGNELSWLINGQNLSGSRGTGSTNALISLLSGLIANPGKPRGWESDKSGGVSITNYSYDLINQ